MTFVDKEKYISYDHSSDSFIRRSPIQDDTES